MEKNTKFSIDVYFGKNVASPKYGPNAYHVESHTVSIPYGRVHHFKSSKSALSFVMGRIDDNVLDHFDYVYVTNRRGYTGTYETLKNKSIKNDCVSLDVEFAEAILTI